ncbi:MAG: laccase family multicopper oxidase [Pseudomonadota bacterium]|jgi:hypothetical protein
MAATCREQECIVDRCRQNGQSGTLLPTPHLVLLGVSEDRASVSFENAGSCPVTMFGASFGSGAGSAFACEDCAGRLPVDLMPGESVSFGIRLRRAGTAGLDDVFVVESDDADFPSLQVPVHAAARTAAFAQVMPSAADFGFVPVGQSAKRLVTVANQTSGDSPLVVTGVAFEPSGTQDFALAATPAWPVKLASTAVEPAASLALEVVLRPQAPSRRVGVMVVTTSTGEVRVPLTGEAGAPPLIRTSGTELSFGDVGVGTSVRRPVTVTNAGANTLHVEPVWSGTSSSDAALKPAGAFDLSPGASRDVEVEVSAGTVGALAVILELRSNDPARPSVAIPVTANRIGAHAGVVTAQLSFATAEDGWVSTDVRRVDLTVESPSGATCGASAADVDFGDWGRGRWSGQGSLARPQRVVVQNAKTDGTWHLRLAYTDDCDTLPTAAAANVLGLSVDALLTYLTGGGFTLDPRTVASVVSNLCAGHAATVATVAVSVDGRIVDERTVTLHQRGESTLAFDLVRSGGIFTVRR